MIYSVTFNQLGTHYTVPSYFAHKDYVANPIYKYMTDLAPFIGKGYFDTLKIVADVIKGSEEDSFLFIITNKQVEGFDKWIKENKLEEFIAYRMKRPVTNGNHPANGRNLLFVAMCSKTHVWRDMFDESIEWSGV